MISRWRGLKAMVQDAVDNGSKAIERVQLETMARPLSLLEQVPQLAAPARGVKAIHALAVSSSHGVIRLVNKAAGGAIDLALDVVEQQQKPPGS